ncbi:MAG: amidohydrolase family protein [Thermoplasmata archaeon]|nr:amidohydrolase family protein [Thermoplasmata archaeon]
MSSRPRGTNRGGRIAPPPGPPSFVLAGRAWWEGAVRPIEIGIDEDGRISRIARNVKGESRRDVGEKLILPAAVDLHVHFRDPGGPEPADSFASGTLQAALGGVGLVADMPNTIPPVTDADRLRDKLDRTRGRLAVDALVYAAASTPGKIRGLGELAGAFKLYLSPTSGIESPPPPAEWGPLLEAIGESGLALTVHAEDPAKFRRGGAPPRSTADWDAERPADAERAAIEELVARAPEALRIHIAHVTDPHVVDRLIERGGSFEVTPHHLLLAADSEGDSKRKVNPPLRSRHQRDALWQAFRAGRIPVLASDHAPHSLEAKEGSFARAPSGMPGVETMLPLLLERVRTAELGLDVLQRASADHPARWLGLPMGRIAPGHRANLLVVDFKESRPIRADRLHAPCGWSAFEGWPAVFPLEHYRDGAPIVRGGEFVGDRGGRVLRPEYAHGPT